MDKFFNKDSAKLAAITSGICVVVYYLGFVVCDLLILIDRLKGS